MARLRRFNQVGKTRMVDYFFKRRLAVMRQGDALVLPRRNKASVSQRERAKDMRALKKQYGLTRSQMGAIGAGHMEAPWE